MANVQKMRKNGIEVASINIERDEFPYDDNKFDVVVANQVMEHTKEIFWITSEVSRILKKGGVFIVGVPNLASLHNRFLLMLGMQPTPIRVFGPHVRAFTYGSFKQFFEMGGYFKVESVKGGNFYPFNKTLARVLSKIFPKMSVSIFLKIRRTNKEGCYIDQMRNGMFETNFYVGNGKTIFDL